MFFFVEEIQRQLDELQLEENSENCEVIITEDDFNTLNLNTAYMRKEYCTCINYLFLVLL